MLNYIWLGLIVAAVIIGGCTDNLKAVADKSFEMAEFAVMKTALPLVGIMALWLGVMRLAERAGLVALLARALRPLMTWLFPEVPPDHPAMGSMLLNMAASILGLGNAATPLGLRAMRDLETLNPHPGTATNAMCTYLAINTSSIQLIPATAIAVLAASHANNPTAIVGTSIMATSCAAIAAVTAAKTLQRLPWFRISIAGKPPRRLAPLGHKQVVQEEASGFAMREVAPQDSLPPCSDSPPVDVLGNKGDTREASQAGAAPSPLQEAATLQPLTWWGRLLLALFTAFFVYLFLRLAFPEQVAAHLPGSTGLATPINPPGNLFVRLVDAISKLSIPFLLSAFPLYAMLRRVKVYEEFVEGAKEGFDVGIRIIPYLIAILVAIGMFRAAGGIDMLSAALRPMMLALHFPPELLPMVLMRPLSGSGTLGMFAELVKQCGPDSLITRMGGTIYGSTETTFYVLAVYFGAVGIKRTRYAVLAGLIADFVGVVASVIICRLVFG
jgi:spore maturation protein SpmA